MTRHTKTMPVTRSIRNPVLMVGLLDFMQPTIKYTTAITSSLVMFCPFPFTVVSFCHVALNIKQNAKSGRSNLFKLHKIEHQVCNSVQIFKLFGKLLRSNRIKFSGNCNRQFAVFKTLFNSHNILSRPSVSIRVRLYTYGLWHGPLKRLLLLLQVLPAQLRPGIRRLGRSSRIFL